jgi:hypothetical protein
VANKAIENSDKIRIKRVFVLLSDGTDGAGANASEAINAIVCIANGFIILHGKCTNGAGFHASAATDTSIFVNLNGHFSISYGFFAILFKGAHLSSGK